MFSIHSQRFGASKYFCFRQSVFLSCTDTQTNAPLDAVLDHVARHELDATLQVFGELLLGPVQVPDECLEGVQLPEEVLRRPGAVTAINPNTHTYRLVDKGHSAGEREWGWVVLWQVQRRMLFLHT